DIKPQSQPCPCELQAGGEREVDKVLNNIRDYLEGERNRLLEEIALRTGQRIDEMRGGDSFTKKEEAATAYSENEKRSAHIKTVQERITELERALDKLEKGTYGLCDFCGKPIPPARLEALPQTTCCIDCKVKMSKSPATATSYRR
ncbi:MAG: TraR/DksA C4-type zinc finger protein, partial [Candidatus Omnitrophica bacterium]|nr:TraR/DksA C4-type zinc finger protein [Candidatus Omnitrophota bacterium]